jgi:hypothetical protein
VAGTCGYGEELSGSINVGNFLTSCKVHWLTSQDSRHLQHFPKRTTHGIMLG